MRITTTNVKPGDRVRGIGLVVTEVTPETDFSTRIEGNVSSRPDPAAGYDADGEYQLTEVSVVLPNSHVVNVVRSDENFRADQVAEIDEAHGQWAEGMLSDYEFEAAVYNIAAKERKGEMAHWDITRERVRSYAFDSGFDASGFYAHIRGEVDESPEGLEPAVAEMLTTTTAPTEIEGNTEGH